MRMTEAKCPHCGGPISLIVPDGNERPPVKHSRAAAVNAYIRAHWPENSDEEIGEALGLAPTTIRVYRNGLGLLKEPTPKGVQPRQWHDLLGTMPDTAVAKRAGVSASHVSATRNRLKIAAFVPEWERSNSDD